MFFVFIIKGLYVLKIFLPENKLKYLRVHINYTVQYKKKTQRQNELILVNLGVLNTNMKFIFF